MIAAEDIARVLNGRRSGSGWLCRCPAHDDHNPSLSITERDGKTLVKCWGGCEQGAVIDALKRKGVWASKAFSASWERKPSSKSTAGPDRVRDPMKPWRNALAFRTASAAHRYLANRGIEITASETLSLRCSSDQWHWPTQSRHPALLARVALADGSDLTSHMTFLTHDGHKAALGDKTRLFAAGGKTAGGGVWFGVPSPESEFLIGEGIESTLSGMRIFDCQAGCAALSANGIRALILPTAARRARIFADNDVLGQGVVAARDAARRWIIEGRAVVVSISEALGDANDVLLKRRRQ